MKKGYYGIGCYHMKREVNYGTLFRSASLLGADFIFLIGKRFKKQASDTQKSHTKLPLFEYRSFEEFLDNLPYGCQLVGVELDHESKPLQNYDHPMQACYLLGAEDSGLSYDVLSNCKDIIQLPGQYSLNVATAGSIVMYDRFVKGVK